jgi:hypothetical protein
MSPGRGRDRRGDTVLSTTREETEVQQSQQRPTDQRLDPGRRRGAAAALLAALAAACFLVPAAQASNVPADVGVPAAVAAGGGSGAASLESAANKAGETGRNVAISLIGLALAVAAVVLAFRRDFKEAAMVFAVGIVCVLLATPAGESLLRDTVKALVGS